MPAYMEINKHMSSMYATLMKNKYNIQAKGSNGYEYYAS